MRNGKRPITLLLSAAMLVLIFDSQTALVAARESIELVLQTVVPALFPFFFLSIWLTSSSDSENTRKRAYIARLFRLPEGLSVLLIPAFLGGYPSGAQAVTSAWEQRKLSKQSSEQLLGFCNNAGPAFLFGIVSPLFPEKWMGWMLWIIHIIGAVFSSHLLPSIEQEQTHLSVQKKTIPNILKETIQVTAQVSGWIVLFRIVIAFLDQWVLWLFPDFLRVFIIGLLELTNGCHALHSVSNMAVRFILCSAMLSLGGCCILLQTRSVTKSLGLHYYYIGKGVQAFVSICFATAVMYPAIAPVALFPFLLFIPQKRSSFLISSGV